MKSKSTVLASVLLWLALSAATAADPKIKGTASVKEYTLVTLTVAVNEDTAVTWRISPSESVSKAAKQPNGQLVFTAPPGKYQIDVIVIDWKAKTVEEATQTVLIEGDSLKPPKPPGPDGEKSELGKKFQVAYSKAPDPASLKKLITAMDGAVALCQNGEYKTVATLANAINTNTKAQVGTGKLAAVGSEIDAYLSTKLPTTDTPINQDLQGAFVLAYRTVAAALKEITP